MPRKPSGDILKLEVRMTPPNQQPITEWYINDLQEGCKMIVCGEGEPNGTPRLHYHIYLETIVSLSSVRKWIDKVLQPHKEPDVKYNGNTLYFTRKPHEHTIPYIVKSRNVLVRVGFAQHLIDEYFKQSDEYNRTKERDRKRKHRSRTDEITEVFNEIKQDIKDHTIQPTPDNIVTRCLTICSHKGYEFPTRMVMERQILTIMYKYDEYLVRSFYTKPFDGIR